MKEASEIDTLLRQIEDELNIHHADYCDHSQGDLLLSFQLRKLLTCVELLKTHTSSKKIMDPENL